MDTMSLQTREGSTLVIVTFLASASLLLLSVDDPKLRSDIAPIGFLFSFLGLSYRQITVWSTDRIQHNREVVIARRIVDSARRQRVIEDVDLVVENNNLARWVEVLHWRNHWRVFYLYAFFREFAVIWFISLPIVLWALYWHYTTQGIAEFPTVESIILAAGIGLWLTNLDLAFRVRDWRRHH
ncbi:MAG: hypothetical protein HMLIMOIP_000865 [Candidatus Nitrosomirales archaeon]|jgi:hypothetical protein